MPVALLSGCINPLVFHFSFHFHICGVSGERSKGEGEGNVGYVIFK